MPHKHVDSENPSSCTIDSVLDSDSISCDSNAENKSSTTECVKNEMEKMVTKKKKKEPSVEISKDSKNDSKSNSKDSKNDSKDSKPSKHDNKKSSDSDHSSQQDSERSTSSDSEKSTKSNETSNVTPNETHKDNDTNIVTVVSEMRVDILRILMMLKHITKDVVAQKKTS